ncbi:porin [Leeia sp. TBRC 13508]|uniref:Porin n=1 Tax=Leeia speluncae TaxID=2884804 RepID=A0ABS8D514_9NEIS|nr:porin [Leeia speluncae]MCB6183274.1 porin [Leeia speluncae]
MKKLIAVAVLSAFAAPAFADSGNVTISGSVQGAYQHDNKAYDGTAAQNRINGRFELTFSGTEDLGNGLSTVWGATTRTGLGTTTGEGSKESGAFAGKEVYVGLKSASFGQVRLGKDLDNYNDGKHSGFTYYNYGGDFFGRTDVYNDFGSSNGTDSRNNVVRYDLPAFGNLTASVRYNMGENKTASVKASKGYTVRADYDTESWDLGGAYNLQKGNSTSAGDNSAKVTQYSLTGAYRFGNGLEIAGEYERTKKSETNASYVAKKESMLYVNYTTGKLGFGGEVGRVKNYNYDSAKKQTLYGLYAHYSLSKRTTAFAELVSSKVTDQDRARSFAIGMKHSF